MGSRSLQTRQKEYQSLGKCIFCLGANAGSPLTDEHIVPFALNGSFIFRDGTCEVCAKYGNKTFEQPALNSDLYLPRVLLELRRRNKKTAKVLPPVTLGDATVGKGGEEIHLDINNFPKELNLVVFQEAGLLAGVDRGGDLSNFRVCTFNFWFHDPHPYPGGVTVTSSMKNGPLVLRNERSLRSRRWKGALEASTPPGTKKTHSDSATSTR